MQLSLFPDPGGPLEDINRRLQQTYGPLPIPYQLDPVSQLILSLIGARTFGNVSLDVFERLRKQVKNWKALLGVSNLALEQDLRPVSFADRKAVQLTQALRIIHARSETLQLEFLKDWPVEDAQEWLRRLPGVDAKVSAAVLNFSTLQKRVLVVDCHHIRVVKRFGLLGPKTPFKTAHRILMDQHIPNGWTAEDLDNHHRLMKLLGQQTCRHDQPRCSQCPLQDICATGLHGSVPEDGDDPDENGCDERIIKDPTKH